MSTFFGHVRLLNKNWTQLETLYLSSNFLTGPLPSDVTGLQSLQVLSLSSNNLNGTIPSWIPSFPSLKYLDLSDNHFNGQLDEFKTKELVWIDLGTNYLLSPIPNSLLNQEYLMFLSLSSNNFSDDLNFSMLSNLRDLACLIFHIIVSHGLIRINSSLTCSTLFMTWICAPICCKGHSTYSTKFYTELFHIT